MNAGAKNWHTHSIVLERIYEYRELNMTGSIRGGYSSLVAKLRHVFIVFWGHIAVLLLIPSVHRRWFLVARPSFEPLLEAAMKVTIKHSLARHLTGRRYARDAIEAEQNYEQLLGKLHAALRHVGCPYTIKTYASLPEDNKETLEEILWFIECFRNKCHLIKFPWHSRN